MITCHKELRAELEKRVVARNSTFDLNHYLGTPEQLLGLSTKDKDQAVRAFLASHTDLTIKEWIQLLDELARSPIHEERISIGTILIRHRELRHAIRPHNIDAWLNTLHGWNQVDCLCQNTFPAEQIVQQWRLWKPFLISLNSDSNSNKRRASLVLLTKPVISSDNPELKTIAFRNIQHIMKERDILITKAVSWLLRSLSRRYPQEVSAFLAHHQDELPKIAIRETRKKLDTGKKN